MHLHGRIEAGGCELALIVKSPFGSGAWENRARDVKLRTGLQEIYWKCTAATATTRV